MLKRALFAGAALVIGATFMHGAVTPASAGPNKPKVKVAPKPRIRIVKPKIRLRVDPNRLKKKETVPDTQQTAVPPNIPGVDEAGREPAGQVNAVQTPDFDKKFEGFPEHAQIGAFKENIEAIRDMLNIAGLDGSSAGKVGLIGEDGKPIIPDEDEQNIGGSGGSSNFDDTGRRGPGSGPDYSDVASDLLGRVSGGLGSSEKMGAGVATAPSPGGALGGIASQQATLPTGPDVRITVRQGEWRRNPSTGDQNRITIYDFSDGGRILTNERLTWRDGRWRARTITTERVNGVYKNMTVSYPPGDAPEKGSGGSGKKIDPGEGITKQQDPDAGGGVVVWIPPNCGSAACNGIRDYLRDPQGEIRRIAGKGTRVQGDREGDPNTGAQRLVIDQHGLVVSYGADSGPAHSGGGRVQRFDPSKFRRE